MSSERKYRGRVLPALGATLFYPCSGNDLIEPVELFSNIIDDFVFVDRGYFSPGHQDTRVYGLDVPADAAPLALGSRPEFEFLSRSVLGPLTHDRNNREIEPCVLTERYLHRPSNRCINIHRRRGYGFSALRKELSHIRVFFYRGDSFGEGGSGNLWLADDHMEELLDKMVADGFIVTDGSNGRPSGKYSFLYPLRNVKREHVNKELISSTIQDTVRGGRVFRCVGFAGFRYGPTLIWRVNIL